MPTEAIEKRSSRTRRQSNPKSNTAIDFVKKENIDTNESNQDFYTGIIEIDDVLTFSPDQYINDTFGSQNYQDTSDNESETADEDECPISLDHRSLLLKCPNQLTRDAPVWLTKIEGTQVYITWIDLKREFPKNLKTNTEIKGSAIKVPSKAIPLMRRVDNDRINATLLLHAGGIIHEHEKGIILSLESNKVRYARKKTSCLSGTWIPLKRARDLAQTFALDLLLDSFLSDNLGNLLFGLKISKKTRVNPPAPKIRLHNDRLLTHSSTLNDRFWESFHSIDEEAPNRCISPIDPSAASVEPRQAFVGGKRKPKHFNHENRSISPFNKTIALRNIVEMTCRDSDSTDSLSSATVSDDESVYTAPLVAIYAPKPQRKVALPKKQRPPPKPRKTKKSKKRTLAESAIVVKGIKDAQIESDVDIDILGSDGEDF